MSNLHSDCFAYKAKNKYPIHTKQATLKSYDQYLTQMQDIPADTCSLINQNFVKAAKLHDIKLADPIEAPVCREQDSYTDSQGNIISFTKLATISDVQKLDQMLDTMRGSISFQALTKVAMIGFTKGEQLGASQSVMQRLQKKAGLGIGDKEAMLQQFIKRATLIELPIKQKQNFYRLYNSMNKEDSQDFMHKSAELCRAMHDIDCLYNLTSHYGNQIQAPENVCCQTTVGSLLKEASDYLHVASTDTVLSKSALLDCKDKVNQFLEDHYNFKAASDQEMLNKVASLSKNSIEALLYTLE